jgi:polyhydroxybutyrate depolymerase
MRRAVRVAWQALFAFGAAAAVACSRDAPPTVRTASDPSLILPRATAQPAPATKVTNRTISVNGASRSYLLVTPKTLDPSPWLVLVFHGDGGTAASFHGALPYENASGSRAVVAYPDGIGTTWDLETLDGNKDEAFIVALVEELRNEFHVDSTHVYGSGYSSGGFFLNVLACHRPGLLRAFASSAAGAPYKQKQKWPNGYPGCPGQKPTAMIAMHGTRDFGVDVKSGRFSAQYWSYVNGCNMREQETTAYEQCRAYRECPPAAPVVYCEVDGLDHWVWDEANAASFSFFERLDHKSP